MIEPEEAWIEGLRDDARLLTFPRHVHGPAPAAVALQIRREWNMADDLSDLIIACLVLQMVGHFQRAFKEERSCRIPTLLKQAREQLHESSATYPRCANSLPQQMFIPPILRETSAVSFIAPQGNMSEVESCDSVSLAHGDSAFPTRNCRQVRVRKPVSSQSNIPLHDGDDTESISE